ncbi:CHAT domain-containing protein [Dyadobacter arcticus]|uniref:CHAT domain-containing protein n=1 Tax=Dyadobacter arcticus TaxID=1078754 RepID=A0ABX0ULA5_9BACT|nr:CHAT domain-containing tetratricopeptide repeat protein [Dyadobacter arcticus]NIJ53779.1 CHAT domain-containing protein [Dyadobacter arcticus]
MLHRLVCVIFFGFILSGSVHAQCPEPGMLYDRINLAADTLEDKDLIIEMKKIIRIADQCSQNKDSIYAQALHILGRTFWYEGKLDSAIIFTKKAISVNAGNFKGANDANTCHSYFNLGCIYNDLGDIRQALNALDLAIKVGQRYPGKAASVAGSYNKMASICTSIGDYEKTVRFSDLGYGLAQKLNRDDLKARSMMEKSQGLEELGLYKESEIALNLSLKFASSDQDEALKGAIFSMLAELKKKQSEPRTVIAYYQKSFESFKKDKFLYGCAQVANNLGFYYHTEFSDLKKALENYTLALQYMVLPSGKAVILNNISKVYADKKSYSNALIYNDQAIQTALEQLDVKKQSAVLTSQIIRSVVNKTELLTIIQHRADTWLGFAKATANDRAKLGNALKTYMLADTMIDYMRWEHTGNLTKLFWRGKTRAMYERAIETCYLLNNPEKAFYFFEKSRAVMLTDQLNELGAKQLLSAKDQKKEGELKKNVADLQSQVAAAGKSADEIRTKILNAQQEQETFVRQIEKSNPQYYAYKYDNSVPTLTQLKTGILGEKQSLVSYFVGDSAVYGLAISAGKVILKKIDLSEYQLLTSQFQKLMINREAQNKAFKSYLSISSKLYELLLKPFNIPVQTRVIVSPDGGFLPFEAFSTSATEPEYLVGQYAFSYTYSAGFLAKSLKKERARTFSGSFLGLAPVTYAPRLSQASLPGSAEVLKTIDQAFFLSKILTGPEASRSAFINNSPDYRIVQLLTHATADSSGNTPTLYFADSTLIVNELPANASSATELLILSACRTGIGKNQKGEGVFSLARGFAGIGIPSILTTLWSVENEPVYDLTTLFYVGLEAGLPLDIALQNAQNEWLKNASPSDRLPYAWAGMVLVGNTQAVSPGPSRSVVFVLLGGLAVLAVFLIYYFRKRANQRISV